ILPVQQLLHRIRHTLGGAFHQVQGRDPTLLNGLPVQFLHLGRRSNRNSHVSPLLSSLRAAAPTGVPAPPPGRPPPWRETPSAPGRACTAPGPPPPPAGG